MSADLSPEQAKRLRTLLDLPDAHLRALVDIAEQQVAYEAAEDAVPPPARLLAGETFVRPISCVGSVMAEVEGGDRPQCTWSRDSCGGFSCTVCDRWVAPGMARHEMLAEASGGLEPAHSGSRRYLIRATVDRSTVLPDGWEIHGRTLAVPSQSVVSGAVDASSPWMAVVLATERGPLSETSRVLSVEAVTGDWAPGQVV